MRLGKVDFVAHGKAPAGQQLFDALMAPDSPVPALWINVRGGGGSTNVAVPVEAKDQFELRPKMHPAFLFPKDEKKFEADRAKFQSWVTQKAVLIHQRAYGITDAKSGQPWLSTGQVAPCIACMIYCRDRSMGALSHFDADMNNASIATVIEEFPTKSTLEVSFFGGKEEKSRQTCIGLLQTMYDLEKDEKKTRSFTIRRFDVVDRPHSSEVTLDTEAGEVYPSYSAPRCVFDSEFRRLAAGTYLIGDGANMAGQCEALSDATLRERARNVRLQFDGRPDHYDDFRRRVEDIVYDVTATTAMQRANNKGDKTKIIAAVQSLGAPELVEANLQSYLTPSSTVKAGAKQYLVEVIIICLINDLDLTQPVKEWLAAEKSRVASQK
jgi:hypothetical protein